MKHVVFFLWPIIIIMAAAIITAAAAAVVKAEAAGLGVTPSSMEFVVEEGSQASRQLIVYNTGETTEFAVSSSSTSITVVPEGSTIQNGRSAGFVVTAAGNKAGSFNGEIKVSNKNEKGSGVSISVETAVGVSVNVVKGSLQQANAALGMLVSLSIVVFGLSIYYATRNYVFKKLLQQL